MNTSTKIQAFLAYTMRVCQALIGKAEDPSDTMFTGKKAEILIWRSQKLLDACCAAADNPALGIVDKSKLKQISRAYDQIDAIGWFDGTIHIESCFAFLLLGFDQTGSRGIDVVIKRLNWLLDFWDSKRDRYEMYRVAEIEYQKLMKAA